jgi:hypothetical protein
MKKGFCWDCMRSDVYVDSYGCCTPCRTAQAIKRANEPRKSDDDFEIEYYSVPMVAVFFYGLFIGFGDLPIIFGFFENKWIEAVATMVIGWIPLIYLQHHVENTGSIGSKVAKAILIAIHLAIVYWVLTLFDVF